MNEPMNLEDFFGDDLSDLLDSRLAKVEVAVTANGDVLIDGNRISHGLSNMLQTKCGGYGGVISSVMRQADQCASDCV